MTEDELNSLSEKVIGCCYTISNALGSGFLEKVYENALAHELRKLGLKVEIQKPLHVIYDGVIVGEYFADLIVEGVLLIELKTTNGFSDNDRAQCINYLNATKLPLCLLINFWTTTSRGQAYFSITVSSKYCIMIRVYQRPSAVKNFLTSCDERDY